MLGGGFELLHRIHRDINYQLLPLLFVRRSFYGHDGGECILRNLLPGKLSGVLPIG